MNGKSDNGETVFCKAYNCWLPELACASRYLNAVRRGQSPAGRAKVGADDPNCRACRIGKLRADAVGVKAVDAYRQEMIGVKRRAWEVKERSAS